MRQEPSVKATWPEDVRRVDDGDAALPAAGQGPLERWHHREPRRRLHRCARSDKVVLHVHHNHGRGGGLDVFDAVHDPSSLTIDTPLTAVRTHTEPMTAELRRPILFFQ